MIIQLNKRVRIEQRTISKDATHGAAVETWTLLAVVWANVQDVLPSRSEAVKNGLTIGTKQKRVRYRYRNDVQSSMRIVDDGVPYQIIGGPAELGQRQYSECMVEAYTV